ncbi:histone-lysine N-methyltransferase SETMAR [Plakobranchus ocellatus]|uniref:Histone-lysine N-methyltransferase SETMAR n=1 Tax=Plakobranchus ocellatus TaxID=259542 RepID=A0AAV3Z7F8_9GAST|nr:histone-lysine N-methyltransferase SETMAR [Plakobranchus ocellatus]
MLTEDPGGDFQANNNLFDNLITGDETWVYLNTPETKRDSMTWKHPSSPVTKKFKVQRSAAKVLATVFWDAKGVILLDILPQGQCINATRYCSTLDSLTEAIRRKRPGLLRRGVVLQHDNATPLVKHTINTPDLGANSMRPPRLLKVTMAGADNVWTVGRMRKNFPTVALQPLLCKVCDSMTWKHPSSPVTKKFKVQRSAAKVLATVFWDAKGVILLDILPQGQCIDATRYCSTLDSLIEAILHGDYVEK